MNTSDELKQYKLIEMDIYNQKYKSYTKLINRYIMLLAYIETQGLIDDLMDFKERIELEIQKEREENEKL
jgi:hypothetical protein